METHTPHHHHVPGKKLRHYLFDFIMLFLAVFCGFLAENMREDHAEQRREKQFVQSIANDIRSDIDQLDSMISIRKTMDKKMDSLLYILNYTDLQAHGNEIYYFTRWCPRTYRFYSNDRTIT